MITFDNFYLNTFAIFKACNIPKRKPDYISKNKYSDVSSKYWYGKNKKGEYIIRLSDHWSDQDCNWINSCKWVLKNKRKHGIQAGKAYLSQFKLMS